MNRNTKIHWFSIKQIRSLACLATAFSTLLPVAALTAPAGLGDWSKARLYTHSFRDDNYTTAQFNFIRENVYLHTIEKRHAQSIYGPASTEVAATIESNYSPGRVLLYWSAHTAYVDLYETVGGIVDNNPSWINSDERWTYPNTTSRNWWVNTANSIVNSSQLSGVFVDGVPGSELLGDLSHVENNMDGLSGLVIYNGYRVRGNSGTVLFAGEDTLEHADGVFVEAFFRGPQITQPNKLISWKNY